jgi:hypothetical protein
VPRSTWLRASFAAVLLLASCATLRTYPGARRDAPDVACLRPAVMPARLILIDAIDDQRLGWLQDRAEILPGEHTARVTVVLRGRDHQTQFTHSLRFRAEAGRDYIVYSETDLSGPRIFILDDRAGSVVAEAFAPASSARASGAP